MQNVELLDSLRMKKTFHDNDRLRFVKLKKQPVKTYQFGSLINIIRWNLSVDFKAKIRIKNRG